VHSLWSLLERAERLHPAKRAFVEGARVEDYATFAARARGLASFLRLHGAAEGERVSGLLWNGIDHAAAYYAAAGAGAIFNPLNTRLAPAELAAIAADCDARLLVSESCFADVVRSALERGAPWRGIVWTDALVDVGAPSWT
jgi:fatty-acyl-CoA synthase